MDSEEKKQMTMMEPIEIEINGIKYNLYIACGITSEEHGEQQWKKKKSW